MDREAVPFIVPQIRISLFSSVLLQHQPNPVLPWRASKDHGDMAWNQTWRDHRVSSVSIHLAMLTLCRDESYFDGSLNEPVVIINETLAYYGPKYMKLASQYKGRVVLGEL